MEIDVDEETYIKLADLVEIIETLRTTLERVTHDRDKLRGVIEQLREKLG